MAIANFKSNPYSVVLCWFITDVHGFISASFIICGIFLKCAQSVEFCYLFCEEYYEIKKGEK